MSVTLFSRFDRLVTLAIHDTLRLVSRIARRYADRIDRTVSIDTLRGYHGFPVDSDSCHLSTSAIDFGWPMLTDVESDMERARR